MSLGLQNVVALQKARDQIAQLQRKLAEAKAEAADHDASFDLRWRADIRATERWRGDDPAKQLRMPDHTDLCVWLLEQWDAERERAELLEASFDLRWDKKTADLTVRAEGAEAALEDISVRARERSEMIKELQGEQRYASQRIAALTDENERLKTPPDVYSWKCLVAYAYEMGGDGARDIERITAEYNRKDADIARLRAALIKLWKHTPKIENGYCAVCRRGYRNFYTDGSVAGKCSDVDCLSHVIEAALSAPGADGGKAPRV